MHQTGLSPSPLQTGRQTLTSNVVETWNPFYGHEAWNIVQNIVHMIIIDHDTVMKRVAMGCLCFITPEVSSIEKFCENYQLLNMLFLYLQKNATDAIL